MWPFFHGEMLDKLRQNDDLLLDMQSHLGLALAVLTPVMCVSGGMLMLIGVNFWVLALLIVQATVWVWLCYASFMLIRYRNELHQRPVTQADQEPHHPRFLATRLRLKSQAKPTPEVAAG